jgi:hypothetical protein
MNPQGHADLGPELRQLAQIILDRIDPLVRSAAALAAARSGEGPGKCQQVWCPVCALAAVANGEEHPLLTVIAEHSVALLAVVRALLTEDQAPRPPTEPSGTTADGAGPEETGPDGATPGSRYQPIPINVEE